MATARKDERKFSTNVSKNFDIHRELFLWRIRCTDFLPYVTNIEGFDKDMRQRLRQMFNAKQVEAANKLFLETLRKSNSEGKWLLFVGALRQQGYELLECLLMGNPVTEDFERYEKFVELLTPVLREKIDPIQLLDYLVRDGYLDAKDKQAITSRVTQEGEIAGTEMLLVLISRLKSDWYHGFMSAMREAKMKDLVAEVDGYFAQFLAAGEGQREGAELSDSFGFLTLEDSMEDSVERGADDDETQPQGGRSDSPTLCEPKQLSLRNYQRELYAAVDKRKNTLIVSPIKSGKRFVALQLIKDHLSLGWNPGKKVGYVVTKSDVVNKVVRRCQVFLSDLPCIHLRENSLQADKIEDASIVVGKAKAFRNALEEETITLKDFTLLILELTGEYFMKKKLEEVYREIMGFYRVLKTDNSVSSPQIVVLTASICGESPLEDLFCTAMETCAQFDIQATAMVSDSMGSLREVVPMPVTEHTANCEKVDNGFVVEVEELLNKVESVIRTKYEAVEQPGNHRERRMSELSHSPTDKLSIKYMTWLKTNKATLGYGAKGNCRHAYFFLMCLKLAQIYQNGLLINVQCRRWDAVTYMRKLVNGLTNDILTSEDASLQNLLKEFQACRRRLERLCSTDEELTQSHSVKNKLLSLFNGNKTCMKVAVLVKHSVTLLSLKRYLDDAFIEQNIKVECVTSHEKDYVTVTEGLFERNNNVLLTTWPILAFHLGKEFREWNWDCVIRMDCPGNGLVTCEHQATPEVSQFGYPDRQALGRVDLLRESTINVVMLTIAELQREPAGEYQAAIRDIQTAKEEWEEHSGQSTTLQSQVSLSEGNFFCHGCGVFVCNQSFIRNVDDLWLGVDTRLIHRLKTIKHPDEIRFSNGYAKLGRFVCARCGQKWGIVVYVLGTYHLAFAKEGLDLLIDGHLHPYNWKWKYAEIDVDQFQNNRDLRRCLPASFLVDGRTIKSLTKRLRNPVDCHVVAPPSGVIENEQT